VSVKRSQEHISTLTVPILPTTFLCYIWHKNCKFPSWLRRDVCSGTRMLVVKYAHPLETWKSTLNAPYFNMAGIALPHLSLTRETESAHGKVQPHRVCFSVFHSIWLATAVSNVTFGYSPPGPRRAHQLQFWPTRMCVGVHWDSGSTKKPGICGLQMRTWAS
jgi:hypothetical protein